MKNHSSIIAKTRVVRKSGGKAQCTLLSRETECPGDEWGPWIRTTELRLD